MDLRDEEIYSKYADELLRFAATLVGPSMAEDVMASAVLHAFSSRTWASVSAPRAYLYRAVLNESRQVFRSSQRRIAREIAYGRPEAVSAPHFEIEVREHLMRLTVRQRAVIYLTYWEDMQVADVASMLSISIPTAKRELRAARQRLEKLLQ